MILVFKVEICNSLFQVCVLGLDAICIGEFANRGVAGIHHKKLLSTSSQNTIDKDLAPSDTKHCAGTAIHDLVLNTGSITENDDDFVLQFSPNQWLKTLHPVHEGLEVGFLSPAAEETCVLARVPGHGQDDHFGFGVENMEAEFEVIPRCLKLVGIKVHTYPKRNIAYAWDVTSIKALLAL